MILLSQIDPHSPADELDLQCGDVVERLNGVEPVDFLDLYLAEEAGLETLSVRKADGTPWEIALDLTPGESLGAHADPPTPLVCGNRCLFCFVHQLPKGMRQSLYIKDEDYRFSYLYGSYITLSNLTEEDWQRILRHRLSPLYISVHAVDPQVRNHLLGVQQPAILPQLNRLLEAGIQLHTQVVVCPGINDGAILDETIETLASLGEGVLSLAIVALGLTGHRQHLPSLTPFDAAASRSLIHQVETHQQQCLAQRGSRFVWPVDEFYLKAGHPFPPVATYEDFPQYENGVGMIPLFEVEAQEVLRDLPQCPVGHFSTLTGVSSSATIEDYCRRLASGLGVHIDVHTIENQYFGGQTSVTGLITGADIIQQLQGKSLGDCLLVPAVMLRDGDHVLLDDTTIDQLGQALQVPVAVIEASPEGLLHGIEDFFEPCIEVIHPVENG